MTGQRDLVVGTSVANRRSTWMDELIGHCVNTVPLRVQIALDQNLAGYSGKSRACRLPHRLRLSV